MLESDAKIPLLILGLGNVLMADDGAGISALEWIRENYTSPLGVLLLDGGTLGLSLLPHLESADCAILIDAVSAEAPPGSILRLDGEAVHQASSQRLSVHQIGVADLLAGARLRGKVPPELVLWGVVPEKIELGVELSDSVRQSIPELSRFVLDEAKKRGFAFRPNPSPVRAGASPRWG